MRKRKLLDKVIDLQGNIRVFCRVRPFSAKEKAEKETEHEILKAGETYGPLGNTEEKENTDLAEPTGLAVTAAAGKFTVTFEEVPGAESYNLYVSNATGVNKKSPKVENITSPYEYSKDILEGLEFFFAVTAVNADGESLISSEISEVAQ